MSSLRLEQGRGGHRCGCFSRPSRAVRINQRERHEAVLFWKQAGVIDDRGQVADRLALHGRVALRRTSRLFAGLQ